MHVTVEAWDAFQLKCSANWMHIAFIVIIAMKLTILLKQFVNNLWNFIVDFPWCNDQMHLTYGDQHVPVYDNDMIDERPSHTTLSYGKWKN